jgi:hypothetical protein
MTTHAEITLSPSFKQAQRAFAAMLDRPGSDAADVFGARTALGALDRGDNVRLTRWLAWQVFARNPQALARIERTDARLAAQVLRDRSLLPVGGRPRSSAALPRTA